MRCAWVINYLACDTIFFYLYTDNKVKMRVITLWLGEIFTTKSDDDILFCWTMHSSQPITHYFIWKFCEAGEPSLFIIFSCNFALRRLAENAFVHWRNAYPTTVFRRLSFVRCLVMQNASKLNAKQTFFPMLLPKLPFTNFVRIECYLNRTVGLYHGSIVEWPILSASIFMLYPALRSYWLND